VDLGCRRTSDTPEVKPIEGGSVFNFLLLALRETEEVVSFLRNFCYRSLPLAVKYFRPSFTVTSHAGNRNNNARTRQRRVSQNSRKLWYNRNQESWHQSLVCCSPPLYRLTRPKRDSNADVMSFILVYKKWKNNKVWRSHQPVNSLLFLLQFNLFLCVWPESDKRMRVYRKNHNNST